MVAPKNDLSVDTVLHGADTQSQPIAARYKVMDESFALLGAGGLLLDKSGLVLECFGAVEMILERSRQALLSFDNIRSIDKIGPVADALFDRLNQGVASVVALDLDLTFSKQGAEPDNGIDRVDITLARQADSEDFILILQQKRGAFLKAEEKDRAGAARSMTGLATMLAHEIKNPLAGVRGGAQLCARYLPQEKTYLTDLIIREVDRIKDLLDDMDIYAVPPGESVQPVNIHAVLDHVSTLTLSEKGSGSVMIKHFYDPSLPPVAARFPALVQIFLNLVKNAVQVMEEARNLPVKNKTDGKSYIQDDADKDFILITTRYRHGLYSKNQNGASIRLPVEVIIADTGPGISDDLLPYIFDPFVSGRTAGTGLGLSLVVRLINELGGRVSANNREKGGAEFRIFLPHYDESPPTSDLV